MSKTEPDAGRVHEQTYGTRELARLQALIDRSTATATASVADSVAYSGRQMSAAEFVEFWRSVRLVAMATVGAAGQPHIAPVHAQLGGTKFRFGPGHDAIGDENSDLTTLRMVIYEDAVRRADLAHNPRVALTTWRDDGATAILYGRAAEVAGSLREARTGRSGKPRKVVEVAIKLSRIYAMRPPERLP
ncbi:MAG TPA: pyridoxamine 5'-phosphate oxidase family protein [Candidatus Binataceae bacterium]